MISNRGLQAELFKRLRFGPSSGPAPAGKTLIKRRVLHLQQYVCSIPSTFAKFQAELVLRKVSLLNLETSLSIVLIAKPLIEQL